MAKDKEYRRLIHSARWLRLRYQILSEHPLCQRCEAEGLITAACEVHHIHPVEEAFSHSERENRMFDPKNLMAVCHDCHVKLHTEMGRCGKKANKERTEKHVKEINEKLFGE